MTEQEKMERDDMELERILKRADKLHVFEKMRKSKVSNDIYDTR